MKVIATAEFSQYAAADGRGAWIVSLYPARLFTRAQAITALAVAELLETGYCDGHPARGRAPRGVAVTNRLFRLTTAVAVVGRSRRRSNHLLPANLRPGAVAARPA